ncbi:hypothetical protein [Methanimicrococcus hongohii]|uniref:hypothetical protein n=1 Tax=Methanimicrococcus hongohii TaxID=3028295 RepID=UPI00292E0A42|nr:hypothetical protein [Methanimicrococcus sp. Hf6]
MQLSFAVSFRLSLLVCNCLLMFPIGVRFQFPLPIRFALPLPTDCTAKPAAALPRPPPRANRTKFENESNKKASF